MVPPSRSASDAAFDAGFAPGFRLSRLDVVVLVAGLALAVAIGARDGWHGFAVAFVVLHFFLFCNVFRMSRPPELVWAAAFTLLAGATVSFGRPGWIATSAVSLGLSGALIARELRQPHYHGVLWRRFNPRLPEWWRTHNRR